MNKIRRFAAAAAAVILCFTYAGSAVINAGADTVSDLRSKYNALEQKRSKLDEELSDTQDDIEKEKEYQLKLDEKISVTEEQMTILNVQISETNQNIEKTEQNIKKTEQEIDETVELYKQRIRASYMSSDPSMLGILLGAESISDFIMKAELVDRISEHDNAIVEKLESARTKLNREKKSLAENKKKLQADKDILSAKQAELNAAYEKSEKAMLDLEKMEKQYTENKQAIESQMRQAESEIQALISASSASNKSSSGKKYSGGKFTWPCPGFNNIYNGYGYRTWGDGSVEFHKGIDISQGGIYGAAIVAAADGTVLVGQNYNSNGYGCYAMIDHGGGFVTLYGHASRIIVSAGQKVKRGQTIGYVGSTGWSTGPHLHFEVRVNGEPRNPTQYL